MLTELRRADELRIGDRVVTAAGTVLTVTSTRMQGVGAGVVSLGFAQLPRRVSYRPRDALSVLVVAARRAGRRASIGRWVTGRRCRPAIWPVAAVDVYNLVRRMALRTGMVHQPANVPLFGGFRPAAHFRGQVPAIVRSAVVIVSLRRPRHLLMHGLVGTGCHTPSAGSRRRNLERQQVLALVTELGQQGRRVRVVSGVPGGRQRIGVDQAQSPVPADSLSRGPVRGLSRATRSVDAGDHQIGSVPGIIGGSVARRGGRGVGPVHRWWVLRPAGAGQDRERRAPIDMLLR